MKLLTLIKEDIKLFINQCRCKKHVFTRVRTIHGDMVNTLGYRSVWRCVKCEKRKTSKLLDKLE